MSWAWFLCSVNLNKGKVCERICPCVQRQERERERERVSDDFIALEHASAMHLIVDIQY